MTQTPGQLVEKEMFEVRCSVYHFGKLITFMLFIIYIVYHHIGLKLCHALDYAIQFELFIIGLNQWMNLKVFTRMFGIIILIHCLDSDERFKCVAKFT